ncbi:MAG: DUF6634 family protein [Gemmobacter sp.]
MAWVAEEDIPASWLALFDERHPGTPREHRHDGEPMLSAARLHKFLQDILALAGLHAIGHELDHPPAPDPEGPFLKDWFPVILSGRTEELALAGTVTGHALLREGRPIVTSNLVCLNEDARLARTMSRWYRLGRRSNLVELQRRLDVTVRLEIRQATDRQGGIMTGETQLQLREATKYLGRAGLIDAEN